MSYTNWLKSAEAFELLSVSLRLPTMEVGEALSNGEFRRVADGLADELDVFSEEWVGVLRCYEGVDAGELFHKLRREYTRLFGGVPEAMLSLYAGIWQANDDGVAPLLAVNKESMAVERFMKSCGIQRAQLANDPFDNIASELEFLQYLCLVKAGALENEPTAQSVREDAFARFYNEHFIAFAKRFAEKLGAESREAFYDFVAKALLSLPDSADCE